MAFENREEAAYLLAKKLREYHGKNPLVLAVPRGAAPMAQIIANELGGELDVVLVHKLRAPDQPELAIGAIDEMGHVYFNPGAKGLNLSKSYFEEEKEEQLEILHRRRNLYTPHRSSINPKGRIVIIVDDGIATGSTMIAALETIRMNSPLKLIVATAVAPPDTVLRLKKFADEVVCLETPLEFFAVGQFFADFSQLTDEEVVKCLQKRK